MVNVLKKAREELNKSARGGGIGLEKIDGLVNLIACEGDELNFSHLQIWYKTGEDIIEIKVKVRYYNSVVSIIILFLFILI